MLAGTGMSVSIGRIGLASLRIGGVRVTLVSKSSTMRFTVDAVHIAIKLKSFLLSWFEEHPFRIEVNNPSITIERQVRIIVLMFSQHTISMPFLVFSAPQKNL